MKKLIATFLILLAPLCAADEIDDIIPFVIQVESSGNPNAVSKAGAIGLMQITPIVLKEYNENNGLGGPVWVEHGSLFNETINKIIGEWYLRRLRDRYLKDISGSVSPDGKQVFIFTGGMMPTHYLKNKWKAETKSDVKLLLVLSSYTGGITRLRKNDYDINKMPKSVQKYVKKVLTLYKNYYQCPSYKILG